MQKMFTDLLLPNLDHLLRGLLGGAVRLQGLDDRDLPGVTRPVLEHPLPTDADPRPCLGHIFSATALGDGLVLNESYF